MFLDFKYFKLSYDSGQPLDQATDFKGHYTAYRRTLIQGMLMMKSRRIRGFCWADSMLAHLQLPMEKAKLIKMDEASLNDEFIFTN